MSDGGGIERIEYKIHADGRIEETVKGVKGNNCHKITEDIHAKLGKVVATKPTEEMYEKAIVIENTVQAREGGDNSGDWGTSTW